MYSAAVDINAGTLAKKFRCMFREVGIQQLIKIFDFKFIIYTISTHILNNNYINFII